MVEEGVVVIGDREFNGIITDFVVIKGVVHAYYDEDYEDPEEEIQDLVDILERHNQ